MATKKQIIERDSVVVKFVGDSGDGMQLSGTLFSDAAALSGNDIATFPDYPAEIRAPHNTVAGVSGFQVHIGKETRIIGDTCDVLVAMNPASLKANLKWVKMGGTIITDGDGYDDKSLEKAGYTSNPLTDNSLSSYKVIAPAITTLAKETALANGLDVKSAARTKNMFCLGMVYYIFDFELDTPGCLLDKRFKKKPFLADVNKKDIEQWVLKITNYADKLLDGLEDIDWPEKIKEMQKNWIGRSEGWEIKFPINNSKEVSVFTTRADTLFGCTYLVLAPEHPLINELDIENKKEVLEYIEKAKNKSERERISEVKDKTGVELKPVPNSRIGPFDISITLTITGI
jgi:Pyruvate/2-oxoacid:ferredoxin oxidoreductase gamma subunit